MSAEAHALPLGRAWAPMDTARVSGHTRLYPDRLEVDSTGHPLVFALATGGIGSADHVLRWQDSSWVVVAGLGGRTAFLHPVIAVNDGVPLIWQTLDEIVEPGLPYRSTWLVASEFANGAYARPDTIAKVTSGNWIYSGANSARRRWAIKSTNDGVRAWYSDTFHVWHRVSLPGRGDAGVAIAPVDDTTALVVWQDVAKPMHWGYLRGSVWREGGAVPGHLAPMAQFPHFRRGTGGTLWLAWSTDADSVQFATFRRGTWSPITTLHCAKRVAGRYFSKELRPSRDAWDRPVITWVEHDATRGFSGTVCLSIPDGARYPPGENLAGSDDAIFAESVRDPHGDVWLVWRSSTDGMFWTHSYVDAIATRIRVSGGPRRPTVTWKLDRAAPGSWWTVMRATERGEYEEAGRVKAGASRDLSWKDEAAPDGRLRYRVRRDCLDSRFRWSSAPVSWPPAAGIANGD